MNKSKILGFSILFLTLFSSNCLASNVELDDYELNDTISIEIVEEYEANIPKLLTINDVQYTLEDISKQENKKEIFKEETQTKQKIVYTNSKYDALNMFEDKIDIQKDGMAGSLELQKNSLNIEENSSYTEQYKVVLSKTYENVPSNELNDIPKIIKENGITYYLTNPVWNVASVEKIEGQDIPATYNGEMRYEGINERKVIKNYLASVTYTGKLKKEETESITFNIKYKRVPQEEKEEKTNYTPIVIAITGTGIIVVSGIVLWKRKKKKITK